MSSNPKKFQPKKSKKTATLPFTAENYYIFFAGVAVILIGFVCMSTGPVNGFVSLTLSPIILIIGYLVLIPLSLIYRKKNNSIE